MKEYKCISCGYIEEAKKDCTCPKCGYKMYPTPYDRDEVLRKEIIGFIHALKQYSFEESDLDYANKEKDDKRFPNYSQITNFVCSGEKTDKYIERSAQTIEELRNHLNTSFSNVYDVSFKGVDIKREEADEAVAKAYAVLGANLELQDMQYPALKCLYSEIPDSELIETTNHLLDDVESLFKKIKKFVVTNNVYGMNFEVVKNVRFKRKENSTNIEELQKTANNIKKILNKTYVIDFFDDGIAELEEMSRAAWKAIATLMGVQILTPNYVYMCGNDMVAENTKIEAVIQKCFDAHYTSASADDPLKAKSTEELFDIYCEMLALDKKGYFGVNNLNLINTGKSEKQLNELIGLSSIKESIKKIRAYSLANKDSKDLNLHMCFYGNPGTGKTEVARIVAGILHENKILPTNKVIEVDRRGLISQYVGETAIKTMSVIQQAMGGVLFIDEAYALVHEHEIYGHEAVATLIKAMEDYRGQFCVILAGYKNPMKKMLESNPGFISRIQFTLDFPNYSHNELGQIADLMLKRRKYSIDEDAFEKMLDITDIKRKDSNFANAREIRNILDQLIMNQNLRSNDVENKRISLVDVNKYITDWNINLPLAEKSVDKVVMSGEDELDALVGLENVKKMVKKIKAYSKRNKDDSSFNMHMCFYGNPGTGKTEVARIVSRILYEAGVLTEAKLVETDARGLIGKYVGETGPKTQAKIDEAMGGVLFIDEAYSLMNSGFSSNGEASYGDEAIAVLLKEMEDKRGQFCVILAGYENEMEHMISTNPGFESRIQFKLHFEDYCDKELSEIAELFLGKRRYEITSDAMERIIELTNMYRSMPNFANARTIRNILDQIIMNQNLRVDEAENDVDKNLIIKEDVDEYIQEESLVIKPKPRIGFTV